MDNQQNGVIPRFKGKIVTNIDDDYIKNLDLKDKAQLIARLFQHETSLKHRIRDSD